VHRLAAHGHRTDDPRRKLVKTVGLDHGLVEAVGHGRDRATHGAIGAHLECRGHALQICQARIDQKFIDTADGDLVGDNLCLQVAQHLAGDANVSGDEIRDDGIPFAGADQAGRQDPDAFLEQLPAIGRPQRAADVGRMRDAPGKSDDLAAMKDRRHHRVVRQMTGREPGIVGDHHIARQPGLDREFGEEGFRGARQDAGERRDAAGVLRDAVAVAIHEDRRIVVGFAHDGRERGAQQPCCRLVGDRDQAIPVDFERDRIERVQLAVRHQTACPSIVVARFHPGSGGMLTVANDIVQYLLRPI
jgi:hypothetical protein